MQTFTKDERLCNKKSIHRLFQDGHGFFVYPFKIVWLSSEKTQSEPVQVLISVSKHNFKKAVDRNKIKRLVREAFRKNKTDFYEFLIQKHLALNVALIYTAKEIPDYKEVEKKIMQIFERLRIENENTLS